MSRQARSIFAGAIVLVMIARMAFYTNLSASLDSTFLVLLGTVAIPALVRWLKSLLRLILARISSGDLVQMKGCLREPA